MRYNIIYKIASFNCFVLLLQIYNLKKLNINIILQIFFFYKIITILIDTKINSKDIDNI